MLRAKFLRTLMIVLSSLSGSSAFASIECDAKNVVREPVRLARCYQLLDGNVGGRARYTWESFRADYYKLSSPCAGAPFKKVHYHVEGRDVDLGQWRRTEGIGKSQLEQETAEAPAESSLQIRKSGKTIETAKFIRTTVKSIGKQTVKTKAIFNKQKKTLELSTTEGLGFSRVLVGRVLLQCK